ncbi:MAG: phage tail protein [Acidobacteria bacterium]|nr:MAG: phage tail protein [Acidobacteriota bacterium]
MGTPFLGEIKIISWNFAPKGWAFCNGQLLPINQNQALFSILGTSFGGDGRVNFALPDFRGRVPIHQGAGFTVGQKGGEEFHTLILSEMPQHIHFAQGTSQTGNTPNAAGALLADLSTQPYAPGSSGNLTTLFPGTISNFGNSQPHENRQPFLVLNFIIALQGVFPSRN